MTPETADVGGWFRTAKDGVTLSSGAWCPSTGGHGRVSEGPDLAAGLDLFRGRPTMVLTGAGMSTGSGLPDYRGPDAVPRSPMTFQEFVGSELSRRRYWARSTVGWRSFGRARPNAAHLALAELARHTPITGVVTQNVDGLHQLAGSAPVVDLHGNLADVICLGCGARSTRADLHADLLHLNPRYAEQLINLAEDARTAPDGDAEVDRTEDFRYPACAGCGGMLKPDVVFFGENAHRSTVAAANALLDDADALLVLGTSLTVMSGLRFVRRGVREGREVVILNDGATRGDDLASLRLHGRLEEVLGAWARITAAHPPRTTEPLRAVDSARSPVREVPHGRRTGSTP